VFHPSGASFLPLDLLQARSSQVLGSMPVDSRLALKLSLKRSSGRQLGLQRPCARRQLCVEGGLWNAAVCHSVDMTNPAHCSNESLRSGVTYKSSWHVSSLMLDHRKSVFERDGQTERRTDRQTEMSCLLQRCKQCGRCLLFLVRCIYRPGPKWLTC